MTYPYHKTHIRTALIILTVGLLSWLVLRPTAGIPTANASTTSASLLGHWTFDEGSGTSASDSSGNGYNGTLINGPTYTSDVPTTTFTNPSALSFDGIDDYVSLPYMIDPATTDFTLSVWFNITNLDTNRRLLQQEDGTGTGRNWLNVYSNGVLHTFLGGGGLFGTQTINTNTWHHAAVTYDGTTLTMYLDGTLDASDVRTMEANDGVMLIGQGKNGNNPFLGNIDDVRLYSHALSTSEIEMLANGQDIVATDDSYTMDEDTTLTGNVLDNDVPLDENTLSATIETDPAHGRVALQTGGSFIYTPTANFNGVDSFMYNAGNGTATATAIVNITINAIDDAPVAVDDSASTTQNVAFTIDVLGNDTDVDGDATLTSVGTPINGTAVISGTTIWYTPPVDTGGVLDTFTYTLSDGMTSSTASVDVTVAFEMESSYPAHQALNVDVASAIVITFNNSSVDAGTITAENIGIYGRMGTYAWTYALEGATLTITPTSSFFAGEIIQVTLSDGIQTTGGISLTATQFQFTAKTTATEACNPTFNAVGGSLTDLESSSAAWGDYDNDGDLDILLMGLNSSGNPTSKIYRKDGGNTFTDISAGLTDVGDGSVAWGDYDNDGDLDILLTGCIGYSSGECTGRTSRVYRNDGSDTFTDIGTSLTDVYASSVTWGDYDNDGDLDILLTGYGNGRKSKIYRNDGSDTFVNINANLTDVGWGSVAWGDYDNDGDLDILLTGSSSGSGGVTSKLYRNDGSDTFTNISAGLTSVSNGSVAWGDYDSDGDLDILLTGYNNSSGRISKVYRNDGTDTFVDISAGLTGVNGSSVAWGDYDNDGDLDILLTGYTSSSSHISKVYRNDGSDTFTDIGAGLTDISSGSVAWGDYDNDGDLDILLSGEKSSGRISTVYRNSDASCTVVADSYTTNEDTTLTITDTTGVLSNDTYSAHPVSLVTDVSYGTLELQTDGGFVYTPTLDFYGTDSFVYQLTGFDDVTATVEIVVTPSTYGVAVDDSYTAVEDTTLTVDSATGVLSNDIYGIYTATLLTDVSYGTLDLQADGSFVYTPTTNFYGTDSFVYQFTGRSDLTATVTITIDGVDDVVVVTDDSYSVEENGQLIVVDSSLLDNDIEVDGETFEVVSFTIASNGSVVVGYDGTFIYIPDDGFTGTDTFTYTIDDGTSTNTATVTIIVEASLAGLSWATLLV